MPNLSEFLRKQQEAVQSTESAEKQKIWLSAVQALFKEIRTWLADVEKQHLLKVESVQIPITEETIGTYMAPALTLTIPSTGKKAQVVPIGRTIIGADGRVDLKSSRSNFVLLYLADKGTWVHGSGPYPDKFPILNEDMFSDLLTRALE